MKRNILLVLVLMLAMSVSMFAGCGQNPPATDPQPGESTVNPPAGDPDSEFNTIALMQENAMGTCFENLNLLLKKATFIGKPENLDVSKVVWTIKHDGDKTINEITARYTDKVDGHKGETENLYTFISKTPMEVGKFLAGKYDGSSMSFFSASLPFLVEVTNANQEITNAVRAKLGVSEGDCKFAYTKIAETKDEDGNKTGGKHIVTLVDTTLRRYLVEAEILVTEDTVSQIAEKIADGTYSLVTKKDIEYGSIYVDSASKNK